MDAKTRDLALLTALSLFCAGVRLDFGLPYFGFGLFCARFSRRGPDVDQLILKRASASRLSGEWSDDDYDVV